MAQSARQVLHICFIFSELKKYASNVAPAVVGKERGEKKLKPGEQKKATLVVAGELAFKACVLKRFITFGHILLSDLDTPKELCIAADVGLGSQRSRHLHVHFTVLQCRKKINQTRTWYCLSKK